MLIPFFSQRASAYSPSCYLMLMSVLSQLSWFKTKDKNFWTLILIKVCQNNQFQKYNPEFRTLKIWEIVFFCWFGTPRPDQKMMVKLMNDLTFLMSKHLYQQQPKQLIYHLENHDPPGIQTHHPYISNPMCYQWAI